MQATSFIKRSLRHLADLILPDGCVACNTLLATGEGPWCVNCALQLARACHRAYCPRCGLTTLEPAGLADGCPQCRTQPWALDGMARVGEYDGILREVIHAYKYGRRQRLDRPLGSLLAAALQRQPWVSDIEALVPVPTSWQSRYRYSFNPPTCMARQVGRELALPVLPMLYERGKLQRQADLPASMRAANVRGKYHLRRGAKPAGATCCVIDDVSTKGATLQEIARVLKKAGATAVYAAVVARTSPDGGDTLDAAEI